MKELIIGMSAGLSAILSTLAKADWFLIYIYVFFMILDLVTGWYKATKKGNYQSKIMKNGLKGKVIELFIIFSLLLLQKAFEKIGIMTIASNVLLLCFALKEFLSIMENWAEAGNKIPKFIQNWLTNTIKNFEENQGGKK